MRGGGSGLLIFASRKFPTYGGPLAALGDSGLELITRRTKEEPIRICLRYVRDSKILVCETFHNMWGGCERERGRGVDAVDGCGQVILCGHIRALCGNINITMW